MNRRRTLAAVLGLVAVVASVVAAPAQAASRPSLASYGAARRAGCAKPVTGHASCQAQVRYSAGATTAPSGGVTPADIADAYALTGGGGAGKVVAIVDAYDDPNAAADLAVYRSTYGLPACTTDNGCLRIVNQRGASDVPPDPDPGWAVEVSLDLDAASAACPKCSILLVEADSSLGTDLAAAVDTAAALGATVVSNSYGIGEYTGMDALAGHYRHAGVSMVASNGDDGFGPPAGFPAVLGNVIAVGGTSLTRATGTTRGWSESAWRGAGSACSAYVAKPAWQRDKHCGLRTVADVSAVADPNSGFVVYDSYGLGSYGGYIVVGGTSLSAPLIAAMIARSGRPLADASWIYAHPKELYDPVGGSTGYCGGDYLCTGKRGYDAPTGMGSPHGLGAL